MTTHPYDKASAAGGYGVTGLTDRQERRRALGIVCTALFIAMLTVLGFLYVAERNQRFDDSGNQSEAAFLSFQPPLPALWREL
jgi:hypothetical protein